MFSAADVHIQLDYSCALLYSYPNNVKKMEQNTYVLQITGMFSVHFDDWQPIILVVIFIWLDQVEELIKFGFVSDKVIAPPHDDPIKILYLPQCGYHGSQETGINRVSCILYKDIFCRSIVCLFHTVIFNLHSLLNYSRTNWFSHKDDNVSHLNL